MTTIQSKIKGALYGFAIGDAMGATTEFMNSKEIQSKYGQVKDIVGGGWLSLKPGEVTDDTQMTLCVCDAIEFAYGKCHWSYSYNEFATKDDAFLTKCCDNFSQWYLSNPPDIGGCCRRVIGQCLNNKNYKEWLDIADNPHSLGNGSLMRTLPLVLSGQSEDLAMLQGRLTHNNYICDHIISLYCKNMEELLYHDTFRNSATNIYSSEGHVAHTLNNALYYAQRTDSFENAIIMAVNAGGDADTIAAITGSLVGALYGYEAIPQRWIDQLNSDTKNELDKYAKLFEKINKKVCTNTK